MGWAPDVALDADPILINLAWRGHCEENEQLERMMYAANGRPLPPKLPVRFGKGSAAARLRTFAAQHNATRREAKKGKSVG